MTATTATTATTAVKIGDLLPVLKKIKPLFPRTPSPVRGLRFRADDTGLTVTHATDHAITVVTLDADVDTPTTFHVDGPTLVKSMEKLIGTVTKKRAALNLPLTVTATGVDVSFDGITTTVPLADDDTREFLDSQMVTTPDAPDAVVDAGHLRAMWRACKTAVGTDDTLPMLTGVNLAATDDGFVWSSTDRFRASQYRTPVRHGAVADDALALLPSAELGVLVNALTADDEPVTVTASVNTVVFTVGALTMQLNGLDAQFPNLGPLFPASAIHTITVDRAELATKVKKIKTIMAGVRNARMVFTSGPGEVSVSMSDSEGAFTTATVAAQVHGEGMQVAFNPAYVLDALESFTGDSITLALTQPSRPCLLVDPVTVAEPDDDGVVHLDADAQRYLLMPIRLPG